MKNFLIGLFTFLGLAIITIGMYFVMCLVPTLSFWFGLQLLFGLSFNFWGIFLIVVGITGTRLIFAPQTPEKKKIKI